MDSVTIHPDSKNNWNQSGRKVCDDYVELCRCKLRQFISRGHHSKRGTQLANRSVFELSLQGSNKRAKEISPGEIAPRREADSPMARRP